MSDPEVTVFTQRALDFSTLFNTYFQNYPVGGDCARTANVIEPEGMSTGRGAQARQPIVLKPTSGNGPVINVGWVDTASREGQLRTYNYLHQQHRARHGSTKFALAESSYNELVEQLLKFFASRKIQVQQQTEFRGSRATVARKGGEKSSALVALGAVGVALLAGLLYFFFF